MIYRSTSLRMTVRKRCVHILLLYPVSNTYHTQGEEFYTPGSLELLEARRRLAEYSLPRLDLTPSIGEYFLRMLTMTISSACMIRRAQKRVAQQRIDSKMPLGRIIDIRKKIFAEVKVCTFITLLSILSLFCALRNIAILVRKSAMSAQYLKCASLPIAKSSLPVAGQEQSNSGMYLLVLQYVPYEVKICFNPWSPTFC